MTGWLNYFHTVWWRINWDAGLLRSIWVVFWLQLRARLRRPPRRGLIAYYPQPAGPWYTLPLALARTGVRSTRNLSRADTVMIFHDSTQGRVDLPDTETKLLNAHATDISKMHVGRVFESVFDYPITLDPVKHVGSMVEKSDENGVHDGRIVTGPLCAPRAGHAYQRLVDSTVRPGVTEDLRCVCVGGDVSVVFRKEKADARRFTTHYLSTTIAEANKVLSLEEQESIRQFCKMMGLDFGSIDVLRDHGGDGRIYIVDVNKTCMPVLSMPWADLETSLGVIAHSAEKLILV